MSAPLNLRSFLLDQMADRVHTHTMGSLLVRPSAFLDGPDRWGCATDGAWLALTQDERSAWWHESDERIADVARSLIRPDVRLTVHEESQCARFLLRLHSEPKRCGPLLDAERVSRMHLALSGAAQAGPIRWRAHLDGRGVDFCGPGWAVRALALKRDEGNA